MSPGGLFQYVARDRHQGTGVARRHHGLRCAVLDLRNRDPHRRVFFDIARLSVAAVVNMILMQLELGLPARHLWSG